MKTVLKHLVTGSILRRLFIAVIIQVLSVLSFAVEGSESKPPSSLISATRSFSSNEYTGGYPIRVTLLVQSQSKQAQTLAVKEKIPARWTADQISHGGLFQNDTLLWPIQDQIDSVTLTYIAYPPKESLEVALFHGSTGSATIGGSVFLPPAIQKTNIQPNGLWRYWTTADGLRETCGLCQVGEYGKIWIRHGSVNQISCLDGYSVQRIPSPGIWRPIYENRSNQLWSYDANGLILFQDGKWISFPIEGFDSARVKILSAAKNHVFLCYPNTIAEFDSLSQYSHIIKYASESELESFTNLTATNDGDVLISGVNGVARLFIKNQPSSSAAVWTEYLFPPEYEISNLDFLIEDETGQLYGSALSKQLNHRILMHLDKSRWEIKYIADRDIFAGWPSVDNGFWLWKSNTFYPYLDYLKIYQNKIHETNIELPSRTSIQLPILESGTPVVYESNHSFWVSLSPGIARYALAAWRTPEAITNLNEHISAICEDPQGRLWFTTFNKLLLMQNQEWKIYPLPEGFSTYQWEPNGIAYLKNGKIAIRNMNSVLLLFDPVQEQFQIIKHPEGKKISLIFPRKDGTLWVQAEDSSSTRQKFVYSLEIYDGETFRVFDNLGDQWNIEQLRYIYEDREGNTWLGGMAEEKVGVYRNGKYQTLGQEYPGDSVMCIFPVDSNKLWFTDRNAIYEYDGKKWRTIRTGLDGIPSIARSRDGNIWIATWNGLYRYDGYSWVQNSEEEGLSSFCIFKVLEDKQGRLWATTSRGLNLYYPEADRDAPKVFIEPQVNVDTVAPGAVAKFTFSGIDKWKYTQQNRLLFSHRIDNGSWSPYTETTIANYPGLLPGLHKFEVKVMDRNWNESQTPAFFSFKVLPPWHQEPVLLFLLISGGIITLSALGYAVSRHINLEQLISKRTIDLKNAHQKLLSYQQQLQSFASEMSLIEERDRRQIAEELHDRIGHGLAACQMQIETIKKDSIDQETIRQIDQTLELLEQTIHDARSLTFEISPPVLYELGLEAAIEWLIEQMEKQYRIQIELEDDGHLKSISEDARGVLFRSARELLFNIVKHSGGNRAKISIQQIQENVCLCVEDWGTGFNVQDILQSPLHRHSFGLFSIRERIEYLGGTFECRSTPGKGTRIVLIMPCCRKNYA